MGWGIPNIKRFFAEFLRKIKGFITSLWDEIGDDIWEYFKEDGWKIVLGQVVKYMPMDISKNEKHEKVYDAIRAFLESQGRPIDRSLIDTAIKIAVEKAKKGVDVVSGFLDNI